MFPVQTLRLCALAQDTPVFLVTSNTSGRAKKAHTFARVEDVALCPNFGLAVIRQFALQIAAQVNIRLNVLNVSPFLN
jgi:hypothetical protein